MSDAFQIRPPHLEEYGACRMLLASEGMRGPAVRYLLAVQDAAPFIAGAAAYVADARITHSIRIRVIRPCRRRGIASQLLERIVETARANGCQGLGAMVDSEREPDAGPFLQRHAFTLVGRITTVQGNARTAMDIVLPLAGRLRKSGFISGDRRIVHIADAPRNALATLYREQLARSPLTTPWSLLDEISSPQFATSPVLLAGDQVAGFLLWSLEGTLGTIPARIVAPAFQGGPTNIMLMEDGLLTGWERGGREIRFDIPHDNSDTEKLSRRLGARLVSAADQYYRRLELA